MVDVFLLFNDDAFGKIQSASIGLIGPKHMPVVDIRPERDGKLYAVDARSDINVRAICFLLDFRVKVFRIGMIKTGRHKNKSVHSFSIKRGKPLFGALLGELSFFAWSWLYDQSSR